MSTAMIKPIHPDIAAFVAQIKDNPPMSSQTPEQNRALNRAIVAFGEKEEVGGVEDRMIEQGGRPIPVRIYRPRTSARAILVYFHGGGFVVGDLDTADLGARILVNRTECVLVSVDYRLAPEHPYPAGLEDCYAALVWAAKHRGELCHDDAPLLVGGESAGGSLTAGVALLARDRGGPEIALQILIYPSIEPHSDRPSFTEQAKGGLLQSDDMRWYWDQYLPDPATWSDPIASPLRQDSLSGVAPALVQIAYHDPLRDEGRAYAEKLQQDGVATVHQEYADLSHGYLNVIGLIPSGMPPLDDIGTLVRARFTPIG